MTRRTRRPTRRPTQRPPGWRAARCATAPGRWSRSPRFTTSRRRTSPLTHASPDRRQEERHRIMNRENVGHIAGVSSRWAALALLSMLWAPLAAAQVVDANSTTMLRLKPEWKAGETRTGFWGTEMVGLSVRQIELCGIDDLNIQLS